MNVIFNTANLECDSVYLFDGPAKISMKSFELFVFDPGRAVFGRKRDVVSESLVG